jgi:hypothetical protein
MRLGKDKRAFLLASFLLFSASSMGQAGKSYKYQLDGNLQKSDVLIGKESLVINYSISEINIENISNSKDSYYRITIPGHTSTSFPGKPELPVFSRLISIPEGAECKIKISDVRSTKINPSGKKIEGMLFPSQASETKALQQRKPEFIIDRKIYAARGIIYSDTVMIESLGTVRNKKLANILISPVSYNPLSNVLEVITSMKIEITFIYSNSKVSKSLISESTLFSESLEKGILNYSNVDLIPGFSDNPVKMVIITDTAFRKQLEPFIKWKTQKGFKLNILYKGAGLAGNTYEQLKDTLTKIYKSATVADPPPDYLLIIGDVNRVPYYGTGNATDMYYGEFDGNGDYLPEMYIGRLPVSDTTEVKSVINKIIQYEKFQFADTNTFYSRAIATAGYADGFAKYMNGQVKYAVSNYLTKYNKIDAYRYNYYQRPPSPLLEPSLKATKDSILNQINQGVSFINYTGHGDASTWLHLNISMDTTIFKNKNMYPFVISNACRTAQFNLPNSLGNRMVVTGGKGAIGFIGCSGDSYWDEDFYWAVGAGTPSADPTYETTGLGAYDRLFHTHNESPSNWYFTMGQIVYGGNLAVSASTSSWKKYYWETYNLVGDPSVIPILGKPDLFNVSLPDTLPNNLKSLTLKIDPFAYVAVSHFDTLWDASYSSPSGSVTLDLPGLSNDSCLIVITGQNKIPVIKTIHFSSFSNVFINLTSTSINDSQGNNNGQADFGEKLYLSLKISNLGLTNATGLYAKISTKSKWATITKDSSYIGTLPGRSDIVLSDGPGITISESVPDMQRITFELTLKDLTSSKTYLVDIVAHAPSLQIITSLIDDSVLGNGNYIADPGETFSLIFKVKNTGSSDISGQFKIVGVIPAQDVTILGPSVKSSGLLKFGEITDIPMTVKLSETAASGSSIAVSSSLDCNPYILNKEFTFRVGRIRESFEASSFSVFPWINLSPIQWLVTSTNSYDGNLSARSGKIPDSGKTSLIIRAFYSMQDSVKFYFKVSSEEGWDYLSFKLNDKEVFKISGEVDWTKEVIAIPSGFNKLEWVYYKDANTSRGSDCAWVDKIDFAETASVRYIQKDLQVARIVSPVQQKKYGQEIVTVKMLNPGKDVINSFNLAYKINNQDPVKQTFTTTINPNSDSVSVSFLKSVNLSKFGIYNITAYGYDNNDDYILNDTTSVQIENMEIKDSLSIFPNPFTDQFTLLINSKGPEKIRISITNLAGIKVYEVEKNILEGKNPIIISGLSLPPSLYFINISGVIFNKTMRVIKVSK